jgi:hypothetical protein
MKTTFLSLLFLAGAVFSSKAQIAPGTGAPGTAVLSFKTLEYNYGKITQGEVVTHEFVFTNSGKEPLTISNAQGSCGCTVPVWPKEPIAVGKTGVIKVTFNSAGKMGAQDKTVTLTSNNKDGVVVLHMKGEVTAKAAEGGTPTNMTPTNTNPK